jgi:hypothetical protein
MMLLDLRLLPVLAELILYSDARLSGAGLVSAWKEIVRWRVSEDSLAVLKRSPNVCRQKEQGSKSNVLVCFHYQRISLPSIG